MPIPESLEKTEIKRKLLEEFQPVSPFERSLVERIAHHQYLSKQYERAARDGASDEKLAAVYKRAQNLQASAIQTLLKCLTQTRLNRIPTHAGPASKTRCKVIEMPKR